MASRAPAYSQFFILSFRGDVLAFRDFRGDAPKSTAQIFFRRVKSALAAEEAEGGAVKAPVFHQDGIQYCGVVLAGLYFVLTGRANVSPAQATELLQRTAELIRDFTGVLSEESVRKNYVLLYELIDEILDFGYAQTTVVEELKGFVRVPPVLVDSEARSELLAALVAAKTTSSKSANQSVLTDRRTAPDELFLDLLEHLTLLYAGNGALVHAHIEGELIMKAFIRGRPRIKLQLNEDLRVGREGGAAGPAYERCVLDQATFHPAVSFTEWDLDRTLAFHPPEGEFAVMRYRTRDDFTAPFRISPYVESPGPGQLDIFLRVHAEFAEPNAANRVVLSCRVPAATTSCSCEASDPSHTWEWLPQERLVLWGAKKWPGGLDATLRVKLNLEAGKGAPAREVGPLTMKFEIPMFVCSRVQIRNLRVLDGDKALTPHRWVRSITRADSYVCRIDAGNTAPGTGTRHWQ